MRITNPHIYLFDARSNCKQLQVWLMILVTLLVMLLAMYAIVSAGYSYRLVVQLQVSGTPTG